MPRKRTLIPSPLAWCPRPAPVAPPALPVLAERGGTQLHTPLPVAIIDTREQNPLSFRRFRGWFADIEERALPLGDYSVGGMENSCVVERKDLADLISSFTSNRTVFISRLRRMSDLPHSLLVITASLTEIKSEIPTAPPIPTASRNHSSPCSPVCACLSSAPKPTNSAKRLSPLISIRPFCMIGWNATAMAAI